MCGILGSGSNSCSPLQPRLSKIYENMYHFTFSDFPFDLPLPLSNESNPNVNASARDGPSGGGETSVHKSLPDFLSDGPIHNRTTDAEPSPSMAESTERRVRLFLDTLTYKMSLTVMMKTLEMRCSFYSKTRGYARS